MCSGSSPSHLTTILPILVVEMYLSITTFPSLFRHTMTPPATVSAILAGEKEVLAKVWSGVHGDVQEQQTLYKH